MSISRPVITDDDGSGTNGTVLNNEFFQRIFDYIDFKVDEAKTAAVQAQAASAEAQEHSRRIRLREDV